MKILDMDEDGQTTLQHNIRVACLVFVVAEEFSQEISETFKRICKRVIN